ncbi:hypothetical protein LTR11_006395, partial [Exophiala xenobiotica]
PDSLDEEGHTPLDRRVALLIHISIRYHEDLNGVSTMMLGLFDSASLLVAAGGHLTQDGYEDFLRLRERCLPNSKPTSGTLDSQAKGNMVKFLALMETAPVLQERPTKRELKLLKAMYRKSTPLSTYADLDRSSNQSSRILRNLFRRLKT